MTPVGCLTDRSETTMRGMILGRFQLAVALLAAVLAASGMTHGAAATADVELAPSGWVWPLAQSRLVRPFVAPAHAYAPGHRGIDLEAISPAQVRAPAAGVVAFAGPVAGRSLVTIDHGNGLVTTLEPVASDLRPGDAVARGDPVGTVALGGHTEAGQVHFGVRLNGDYINPLLLLGGVPRAVLLPCCDDRAG